jgi:hypothetical protein
MFVDATAPSRGYIEGKIFNEKRRGRRFYSSFAAQNWSWEIVITETLSLLLRATLDFRLSS